MTYPRVTIIGAGLGGSLLGIYLARRGWPVQLFELRGDLRREPVEVGRSIKLTLAERGLAALAELVRKHLCVPLRGRAIHSGTGTVTYQPRTTARSSTPFRATTSTVSSSTPRKRNRTCASTSTSAASTSTRRPPPPRSATPGPAPRLASRPMS
jgi:2-polyprenyl-6-methoxyphenol hydroxylase-like FAD-dependent oxidoreductase